MRIIDILRHRLGSLFRRTRMEGGKLVLGMALVPFDQPCVGSSGTYAVEDAGQTLRGIDPPACMFPGFRELGATDTSAVMPTSPVIRISLLACWL